ncbi:MAG TPA: DUF1592 domain-containing protein, partial [Verrucomicrobiae bacterium]|nr:DUF1592 domain-containing protein [Verrucomicrobiae bacterium]
PYTFPRDGEYEIHIRLARDRNEEVEGLREPHEVLVLVDRKPVKSFTVVPPGGDRNFEKVDAHLKFRLPVTAGPHEVGVTFAKNPSSLLETKRQPYQAHYNMHRHPRLTPAIYQVSINGPYDSKNPGDTPSRRRIFVSYPVKPAVRNTNEAPEQSPSPLNGERAGVRGGVGTEHSTSNIQHSTSKSPAHPSPSISLPVEGRGKLEDTSHTHTRTAEAADEDAGAERILSTLMRRAYRRPVAKADLQKPMEFYQNARAQEGFEAGIESALSAVLVSPEFLFRIEQDPPSTSLSPSDGDRAGVRGQPGRVYRVSDLTLASRLSFFLWSSIPDDELLASAERGELHKPKVLEKQVRRMLADPRSENLVRNFAEQWLHLRNLESITPDLRLFPDFDDNLRQAFRRETEMHFETVLRDDRSVLDLLKADYTFVNERLAKHYGIPNVYGSRFRRVALDKNSERGGLLRQGSVLTVTSYATRTSPVIRGKWVLENLVGTPPPPPLPDVPALMDNTVAANLSVRARLAEHRSNAACASCHNLMDPIGLSLEQYDAIGRWRTLEDGLPIDATGGLPDGSKFAGVAGLEAGLLKRPDIFVNTLTEKLMTFALGRGVESNDAPAVRKIVHDARSNNYRFSAIILGIVNSTPFTMRKSL